MAQIINYAEYLMATTGKRFPQRPLRDMTEEEEEAYEEKVTAFKEWYQTSVESTPDWFVYWQDQACNIIRKQLAQVHLFPRNRMDYLDLKEQEWVEYGTGIGHIEPYNYKELVRNGIAEQIKFMYDNSTYFENGYINASNTFAIGTFTMGQQSQLNIDRIFNKMCPNAYNNFETMGWTYTSLSSRLDSNIFYKGEH